MANRQKKILLMFLNLISLPGIISILLLSEPVAAIPGRMTTVAQQPATSEAAETAYAEAEKLFQQGTSASLKEAITKFEEAAKLYHQMRETRSESAAIGYIGYIYSLLGEKPKALEFHHQALLLRKKVGDKRGEAITLNHIGSIYDDLGEKQKALEFYNQALPLRRQIGDKRGEATTLNNIALLYDSLGEKQQAVLLYNQVLPLRRAERDKRGEAITLNNIGSVYDELGEKQKALDFYNQALPICRLLGDKDREATTLNNIGSVYNFLKENQKALTFYNQALPLKKLVGDRSGEANILNNIASVYDSLKEKQKALTLYNQALTLYQDVGDRGGEANTLRNLAYLQRNQGNLNEALIQIQSAIKIIENLRTKITSETLRTSYFSSVQSYYKLYIDLLMQLHKQQPSKGYDALALHANESARARSLLELITEANADIRQGVDSTLLQAERNIQKQLDNNEKLRIQLLNSKSTPEQIQALETETATLLKQSQDIKTQIRIKSPRYAALTQPQPLTLPQIQQQVLGENTLLLEYSLGEEKSYLWAVSKTEITSYELPKNADIVSLVKKFRNEIIKPQSGRKIVARAAVPLTQILLNPVAEKLANKRLVIVGDGALQYLPFAALISPNSDPEQYKFLIVNHEIITLPSASTVAILRTEQKGRKTPSKGLALLADPVFDIDDERFISQKTPIKRNTDNLEYLALKRAVSDTDIRFARLRFTRKEAEKILNLIPKYQSLQAYDFAANRQFATSSQLSQYRIIHFATHGIVNSKQPELSGLVLSLFDQQGKPENGFLRLHDIFNLKLSADLVVLSACQTGLGKEIAGEGLIGLTRGFMYAGSSRVVMSLWNVSDQGTSVLMGKFYQKMLQGGLKPATALREAQIEMLNDKRFSKPDYWAAFTIQGDW
ncbi:CHAT domain-containing protein [Anabaena sphaerica FACHB-251]|uniref:CHAT domain-containing protein n=1 Tax=Anabaena sphaerica FACHB-251 TaxID=2692883 RepID=A0A926WMZ9_9NOST|nr:CHAT domain-containing tetratricopeptide repeat protein [Anabaena sphaerica]MBD2296744.1 CHAT domain-containing protein [Anabaena sphaerica FACHB-251]